MVGAALAELLVATAVQAATLKDTKRRTLRVKVVTNEDGGATKVTFAWRAKCRKEGTRFRDTTVVEPDGDTAFRGVGGYTIRQRDGIRIRVTPRSTGRRVSDARWKGTFSGTATVRRRGKVIDRCRLAKKNWSATAPAE